MGAIIVRIHLARLPLTQNSSPNEKQKYKNSSVWIHRDQSEISSPPFLSGRQFHERRSVLGGAFVGVGDRK